MDQLHQDVGNMVEKITKVIAGFRHLQLKMEEYVCLKVISMVSAEGQFIFHHYRVVKRQNQSFFTLIPYR